MSHLPLIVGFGGINPAGRSSSHHAYRRLILEQLDPTSRQETLMDLATLTGLASYHDGSYHNREGEPCAVDDLLAELHQQLLDATLIRRIESSAFAVDKVTFNKPASLLSKPDQPLVFTLRKRQLPINLPANWRVIQDNGQSLQIQVEGTLEVIFPDTKTAQVQSAGQLPSGFKPAQLYQSRNHPRNLQMTVFAASDALRACGIPFDEIMRHISPDQLGVYASNSIGQLDDAGFGGLLKFPSQGRRTTSKQMPLGYAQMPADFVNAYLLGNVGSTGGALGACATFLYNLHNGVTDIRSGKRKVVLVGGSDAPITPEIIEGFRAMGALAEDRQLAALDNKEQLSDADYRRACRPFAQNCGFTIGESSQFVLLMSDDLALELGAQVFGAVPDVFINADGHKKSISAPGIGNYITLGKAASLLQTLLGSNALQQRSYVQAHGTSTPQNRVTESHVINEVAKAFAIPAWPVAAIKCYLGHSQGTAGGDQLSISLGTWAYGYIPGIATSPVIAEDVQQSHLRFFQHHLEVGNTGMDAVILNSKGFGGNNASAPVLAPHIATQMLQNKYGKRVITDWQHKRQQRIAAAHMYDLDSIRGVSRPIYRYDYQVLEGSDLNITAQAIHLPGYAQPISLQQDNPFSDFSQSGEQNH